MGMKLKSGADLCGFELSRFCVQNDVAIPDAPASGRKYFHTGTGMEGKYSLLGRERIFTGTSWRAAAYVDDLANLDLATNADYLALKEKVELLSGEVDTDAIINNMKEVTAFLEGFAEDASLMNLLNSKFDKTGGTINGRVTIDNNNWASQLILNGTNTSAGIKFQKAGVGEGILYSNGGILKWYKSSSDDQTLLHSGNVGDYALKTDGSNKMSKGVLFSDRTLTEALSTRGTGIEMFKQSAGGSLSPNSSTYFSVLHAVSSYAGLQLAVYGGNSDNSLYYRKIDEHNTWTDWKRIAFTDSTVEAAWRLKTPRTIWGQSFDGTGDVSGTLNLNLAKLIWHGEESYSISCPTTATAAKLLYQAFDGHQFECAGGIAMLINSSGNVTIGGSDLAGTSATAKLYVDGYVTTKDGVVINAADAYNSYWEKGFLFSSNSALNAGLWGYGYKSLEYLYLGFGNYSAAVGIRINENGNVGIGTADPRAKLHVGGDILLNNRNNLSWIKSDGNIQSILQLERDDKLYLGYGLTTSFTVYPLSIFENDIQSKGDIVANGTIACKGVAAEGSAPVGTVDKWAGSIVIGTKSQTYTHALGTTDITVAIYEKNGNEWVQILTDVDIVNANTIRVTFGANTTVEHRIVVMG